MKLLLTSAGITNNSIAQALRDLLGKPTNESKIVIVPTGQNPEPGDKGWVIDEDLLGPYKLGWKELNIIDLAAVASLDTSLWWPQFEEADVLLFGGGNCFYLSYWLQKSGVYDAMPKWLETKLYIGISAGSMVATESLRTDSLAIEKLGVMRLEEYGDLGPNGQSSQKTLMLVDFAFRPHLNSPEFPKARADVIEKIVPKLDVPLYALDDQSALKVVDGNVEVISEGKWLLFDK
ncbi:MAG TPA: Type 1 glutamine amidotransferase-like domain-containing protein [Candidatus Saccharimonadales bacterium]|nr:Type 1 glutamine amidotransferase-like domain-containing protein [Candidatus Saccharimonadales bacterium]